MRVFPSGLEPRKVLSNLALIVLAVLALPASRAADQPSGSRQQNEDGVELFYNMAITPWCRLTADLQVGRPSTRIYDTVILAGLRLQIVF